MSVTLDLPDEIVRKLRERAGQRGQTIEEYLVTLAQDTLAVQAQTSTPRLPSPADRAADFQAWAASHDYVRAVADDSRESIYAGRGQ